MSLEGSFGARPRSVVTVAQLVEPWTVTPVVAGSNPVSHPTFSLFPNSSYVLGLWPGVKYLYLRFYSVNLSKHLVRLG